MEMGRAWRPGLIALSPAQIDGGTPTATELGGVMSPTLEVGVGQHPQWSL